MGKVGQVMSDGVYVGSTVQKDLSAYRFLSGRFEVGVNKNHVMVTESWDNLCVGDV